MPAATSMIDTKDGIQWYCERSGAGPDLVLIPSGEGDCESFAKVAASLASSFTVTTFDMPGMSRTTAPSAAMEDISASKLATQIIGLMDELHIVKATFWGCSSGALAALTLAAEHPDRVRSTIVHEAPLASPDSLKSLKSMSDEDIVETVSKFFATGMVEDEEKWKGLGRDFHERLKRNYVTWVRTYVRQMERNFSKEELRRRPCCWTIGALTPAGVFYQNVVDGFAAGIPVGLLPCKHFPQVTIPEVLAEHIRSTAEKHL